MRSPLRFRALFWGVFYFGRKSPGEMFSPSAFLNKDRQNSTLPSSFLGGRRGGAKRVKSESVALGREVGGPPAAVEEKRAKDAAVLRRMWGTIPALWPRLPVGDLPWDVSA